MIHAIATNELKDEMGLFKQLCHLILFRLLVCG